MMEEQMTDLQHKTEFIVPRRTFFSRFGGAVMVGLRGLAGLASRPSLAQAPPARAAGTEGPGTLTGQHKQVVDGYEENARFPLAFAYTFLAPNESATAVIVLRHGAFPLALGHAMWEKYKIGEFFKIIDPETKAAATKNPFLNPKPG